MTKILICLVLLWALLPDICFAWSKKGHAAIALGAVNALQVQTKNQVYAILQAGPWVSSIKAANDHSLNRVVGLASNWPDWIRDKTLSEIFIQYGSGKVPDVLAQYSNKTTQSWHFANTLFLTQSLSIVELHGAIGLHENTASVNQCIPEESGQLFHIWPLLISSYKNVSDIRDKAIILAFLLHLGADAYQPLHVLSMLNTDCKHDRGGNLFCVAPQLGFKERSKCKQNLHQLWDSGFGFFDQHTANDSQVQTSEPVFSGDALDLTQSLVAVKPFLLKIYPAVNYLSLDDNYQHNARNIVKELSYLGTRHLNAMLINLEKK